MKFVHLTPQPKLKQVRKNGIQLGNGRRGRGVYAVPLMMLPQVNIIWNNGAEDYQTIDAGMRSSLSQWRWLRTNPTRHRNMAAIVFDPSEASFPADLFIEMDYKTATSEWVKELQNEHVDIDMPGYAHSRKEFFEGYDVSTRFRLMNKADVGKVMNAYVNTGSRSCTRFSEKIEIVFSGNISSNSICRIIALYKQTNDNKRRRREIQMRPNAHE